MGRNPIAGGGIDIREMGRYAILEMVEGYGFAPLRDETCEPDGETLAGGGGA